eukprot:CAMPEP_0119038554 /NCGR_PEP_ID=MMETSP1177-20130426/7538_1 /TAXON_ID=2985 /ORGANISM="Ochromonas sp, Strain CCMP1899" /LENGTH=141 /DNA_ID=CAMNT_0007001287 /DNA_START=177 /DNA_END=602 /DNA_ORIENTATION=-
MALFAAGGLTGSYLGWRQNNIAQKQRFIDNIEVTRKRNEKLDLLELKMRNKGIIMPTSKSHDPAKKTKKDIIVNPVGAEFDIVHDGGNEIMEIIARNGDKHEEEVQHGDEHEKEKRDKDENENVHDVDEMVEIISETKNEG